MRRNCKRGGVVPFGAKSLLLPLSCTSPPPHQKPEKENRKIIIDKPKKAWYNQLNAMTKTSKKRYVSTESCRLMRGADMPFSEYTCEHCTESYATTSRLQRVRPLHRQTFNRIKVYKALRVIAGYIKVVTRKAYSLSSLDFSVRGLFVFSLLSLKRK